MIDPLTFERDSAAAYLAAIRQHMARLGVPVWHLPDHVLVLAARVILTWRRAPVN